MRVQSRGHWRSGLNALALAWLWRLMGIWSTGYGEWLNRGRQCHVCVFTGCEDQL